MTRLSRPSITIVVPTRDRPATLASTIESCLDAADNETEVLVADNASSRETGEVLRRFDGRIRVERSATRLAMSHNYEFALEHVASDFVLFLGDDDALLPSAISTFRRLNDLYPGKTITWRRAAYYWPDHPVAEEAGLLSFSWESAVTIRPGTRAVQRALCEPHAWQELPMIYHAFFPMASIRQFLERYGSPFFRCITPDIYSGFCGGLLDKEYVHSTRPLSINGVSAQSTGMTIFRATHQTPGRLFEVENRAGGLAFHEGLDEVWLLPMVVAEAFLRARAVIGAEANAIRVDTGLLVRNCFLAIADMPDSEIDRLCAEVRRFAGRYGLEDYALRLTDQVGSYRRSGRQGRVRPVREVLDPRRGPSITIDGHRVGVDDVASAARLVDSLLEKPVRAGGILARPGWLAGCAASYATRLRRRRSPRRLELDVVEGAPAI